MHLLNIMLLHCVVQCCCVVEDSAPAEGHKQNEGASAPGLGALTLGSVVWCLVVGSCHHTVFVSLHHRESHNNTDATLQHQHSELNNQHVHIMLLMA